MLAGAGAAASLKATRQESARSQGLTVRMLVAVTARSIHILSLPMAGNTPQKELMSFERGGTKVEISKFGLSRRLKLTDSGSGQHLGLTGSAAPFSPSPRGTRRSWPSSVRARALRGVRQPTLPLIESDLTGGNRENQAHPGSLTRPGRDLAAAAEPTCR